MKIDLSCKIAGIKLKNPVLTASGTFGFGVEFEVGGKRRGDRK